MTHHKVEVLKDNGTVEQLNIKLLNTPLSVELSVDGQVFRGEADDYFFALVDLRLKLEKHNIKLLCKGSALDVYPSRMTLQMSDGRQAYKLTLGKQAFDWDLIDIFSPLENDKASTVQEQKEYYERWRDSLRIT